MNTTPPIRNDHPQTGTPGGCVERLVLHHDLATRYRDGLNHWACNCPRCHKRMRKDTAIYYFCRNCKIVWELEQ